MEENAARENKKEESEEPPVCPSKFNARLGGDNPRGSKLLDPIPTPSAFFCSILLDAIKMLA